MSDEHAAVPPPGDPRFGLSLRNWEQPDEQVLRHMRTNVALPMGWGRLIFGHTFESNELLARCVCDERPGQRDIALYLRDPHVVLSLAPSELFLDPSHTYRLWLSRYRAEPPRPAPFHIRHVATRQDLEAINRIYVCRHMAQTDPDYVLKHLTTKAVEWLVAEDHSSGQVIGTVTLVDHQVAFRDPERGASLWCLAVDPQAELPGVGRALVTTVIERARERGAAYLDLSVMHDNEQAIALYDSLGFERVPVFCVKRKNAFNEPLFIGNPPETRLNPYASIIIDEARARGIVVEVLDEEANYFSLHLGGRSVVCRESLTELTSAIAMSRCDDKRVTRRILEREGLNVPAQRPAGTAEQNAAFLRQFGSVVVKPARGEQGAGISVDLRSEVEVEQAVARAREVCTDVILEQFVEGQDLRIVVINFEVVAAAIRKPAQVIGTGRHTVRELIEKQSRRRAAATGGESRIPLDGETERCVRDAGYEMDSVLPPEQVLVVRRTANLHTGGTIHDVTAQLHPDLADAAVRAARAINIPVTGLDFLVPRVDGPDYWIIEANERPGLANHEPQPTAQKFVDFLFPHTRRDGGLGGRVGA